MSQKNGNVSRLTAEFCRTPKILRSTPGKSEKFSARIGFSGLMGSAAQCRRCRGASRAGGGQSPASTRARLWLHSSWRRKKKARPRVRRGKQRFMGQDRQYRRENGIAVCKRRMLGGTQLTGLICRPANAKAREEYAGFPPARERRQSGPTGAQRPPTCSQVRSRSASISISSPFSRRWSR